MSALSLNCCDRLRTRLACRPSRPLYAIHTRHHPHLGSLLKFRHDLHAHPELRYEEHRTGDKVAAYLQALGLQVHRGLGRTGVVASIHGRGTAPPTRAAASASVPTWMRCR